MSPGRQNPRRLRSQLSQSLSAGPCSVAVESERFAISTVSIVPISPGCQLRRLWSQMRGMRSQRSHFLPGYHGDAVGVTLAASATACAVGARGVEHGAGCVFSDSEIDEISTISFPTERKCIESNTNPFSGARDGCNLKYLISV